jgi:excisionase family DNA binding protein
MNDPSTIAAPEKLLLTDREVAELVGVTGKTIRNWADAGTFPAGIKMGRLRRWRRADVLAWIAAQ